MLTVVLLLFSNGLRFRVHASVFRNGKIGLQLFMLTLESAAKTLFIAGTKVVTRIS